MDLTDIFLGILFGFIIIALILKNIRESTFNEPKEKLTTKEVMKKLEQIVKIKMISYYGLRQVH